jgi:hypothetical protein
MVEDCEVVELATAPCVASAETGSHAALKAYGFAALAMALFYAFLHLVHTAPSFPLDDPYITLHSAQVLHWGSDPNYIGVSPLYGATSAPFLALVYLLLFVLKPLYAIDTACWIGALFYAFGLVKLARTLRLSRGEGIRLVGLGLGASYVPVHIVNGLETSWALGAIAWSLAFASGTRKDWKWAALAAGIAAAIRPELGIFAVLLIGALALMDRSAKTIATLLTLAALPLIPGMLSYFCALGSPFPQTAAAKRYFMAQDHLSWLAKVTIEAKGLSLFAVSCALLLFALAKVWRSPIGTALIAFTFVLLGGAFLTAPSSIAWNFFRYLVILVPMMVWAAGFRVSMSEGRGRLQAVRFLHACSVYAALFLPISMAIYQHECAYFDGELHSVADWCQANLPSDAVLLVHDAGYIAYATHFHTVDLVGLKTPEAMDINRRVTWPSGGTNRALALADVAIESHATYLIVRRGWSEVAALPGQLRALHWQVDPLRLNGEYRVFRVVAPVN